MLSNYEPWTNESDDDLDLWLPEGELYKYECKVCKTGLMSCHD
jgi:hypothetical protein